MTGLPEPPDHRPEQPEQPDHRPEQPPGPAEPPAPADPAEPPAPADPAELTGRDRALLALEQRGWPGPGAKERAIREQLGISPTRYYQLLGALLDDPRAAEYAPVTVNRLRRTRQARRDQR